MRYLLPILLATSGAADRVERLDSLSTRWIGHDRVQIEARAVAVLYGPGSAYQPPRGGAIALRLAPGRTSYTVQVLAWHDDWYFEATGVWSNGLTPTGPRLRAGTIEITPDDPSRPIRVVYGALGGRIERPDAQEHEVTVAGGAVEMIIDGVQPVS